MDESEHDDVRPAADVLTAADTLHAAARAVLDDHARACDRVRSALRPLRDELVRAELAGIDVSRLKDVTEGRLRVGALVAAGYTTVARVLDASPYQLQLVPGIGAQTAAQTVAAARRIAHAVEKTVAVRIDADRPEPRTAELVGALFPLVAAGPERGRCREGAERLTARFAPLLRTARPARGRLRMLLTRRSRRDEAYRAVDLLRKALASAADQDLPMRFAQTSTDLLRLPASEHDAWSDFAHRPVEFYSVLGEVAEQEPLDAAAAEGFLPPGIADAVRAQALDDSRRRVSLRGYQDFGARFALAQGRVILGDEMGLGKTVQAIAVLAHLRARGETHFLVVAPASVLVNWIREVESHSALRAFRLHGPQREAGLAEWLRHGDVAVTTFDALRRLDVPADRGLGVLVVDEAHFVKNPDTQRSQAVAAWAGRVERVLFLTGTPMENRVGEFRSLVRHLRPELLSAIGPRDAVAGPKAFRQAVAPVYLRRNQEDVLTELPDLVRVDEWEELSAADRAAYRLAVAAGNFMAMRQAAYAVPKRSAKMRRLVELVDEADANGLKTVVFSFFRDVLTAAQEALGQRVFGPLTGAVPAERRQEMVDAFSAAPGPAVLLAQIQAGGTGLNLQAASVVVLCEPQVKPTLESQAVARAHRLGQVRRVQVHRLLAPDTVDERMLHLLEAKRRAFDAYARRSAVAESSPDAVDISEPSLARQIVEEEQQRLAREREGQG